MLIVTPVYKKTWQRTGSWTLRTKKTINAARTKAKFHHEVTRTWAWSSSASNSNEPAREAAFGPLFTASTLSSMLCRSSLSSKPYSSTWSNQLNLSTLDCIVWWWILNNQTYKLNEKCLLCRKHLFLTILVYLQTLWWCFSFIRPSNSHRLSEIHKINPLMSLSHISVFLKPSL